MHSNRMLALRVSWIVPALLCIVGACSSHVCPSTSTDLPPHAPIICDGGLQEQGCRDDSECVLFYGELLPKGTHPIAHCVGGICHSGDDCSDPNAGNVTCSCGGGPTCELTGVCVMGCDGKASCEAICK